MQRRGGYTLWLAGQPDTAIYVRRLRAAKVLGALMYLLYPACWVRRASVLRVHCAEFYMPARAAELLLRANGSSLLANL